MSLVPHGRLLTCPAGCDSNAIKSFGFPYSTPISLQMRWSMYYSQNHGFKSRELHVRGTIVGVNSAARMRSCDLNVIKNFGFPFSTHGLQMRYSKGRFNKFPRGRLSCRSYSHISPAYTLCGAPLNSFYYIDSFWKEVLACLKSETSITFYEKSGSSDYYRHNEAYTAVENYLSS